MLLNMLFILGYNMKHLTLIIIEKLIFEFIKKIDIFLISKFKIFFFKNLY